jgi:hypothetical protein
LQPILEYYIIYCGNLTDYVNIASGVFESYMPLTAGTALFGFSLLAIVAGYMKKSQANSKESKFDYVLAVPRFRWRPNTISRSSLRETGESRNRNMTRPANAKIASTIPSPMTSGK